MKDISSKRRKEVLLIQDNAFGDAVIFIQQINPGLSLFHIDGAPRAKARGTWFTPPRMI